MQLKGQVWIFLSLSQYNTHMPMHTLKVLSVSVK